MKYTGLLALAAWLPVAGCGSERQQDEMAEGARADTGMAMPTGGMRMPSMDMLPAAQAYVDSLARTAPGELTVLADGHRARIEPMLEAMDRDMVAMRMPADSAWRALADSVRADLATIPELNGEPLVLRMRAHAGRMRRLLDRHESMMRM